jgi:hypothetical protein
MRRINSIGVDLMPLLTFMAETKTRWEPEEISVPLLQSELERISSAWNRLDGNMPIPFLRETTSQFTEDVLHSLSKLKQSILTVEDHNVQALFLLAFASILVASSVRI